jgi:predicted nuclease of predicted toxin-antitoxin system
VILLWLDNHLSPAVARWLRERFEGVDARAVRNVGLRHATDIQIFETAFAAGAVLMTKDSDFRTLLERLGDGPQVVLLTCGNTSNLRLREILEAVWPRLVLALATGQRIVEVRDESSLA